jgi:hypothetical protein
MPLAIEEVIPGECYCKKRAVLSFLRHPPIDLELKERIEAFLTERKNNRKAASSVPEEKVVTMDVN